MKKENPRLQLVEEDGESGGFDLVGDNTDVGVPVPKPRPKTDAGIGQAAAGTADIPSAPRAHQMMKKYMSNHPAHRKKEKLVADRDDVCADQMYEDTLGAVTYISLMSIMLWSPASAVGKQSISTLDDFYNIFSKAFREVGGGEKFGMTGARFIGRVLRDGLLKPVVGVFLKGAGINKLIYAMPGEAGEAYLRRSKVFNWALDGRAVPKAVLGKGPAGKVVHGLLGSKAVFGASLGLLYVAITKGWLTLPANSSDSQEFWSRQLVKIRNILGYFVSLEGAYELNAIRLFLPKVESKCSAEYVPYEAVKQSVIWATLISLVAPRGQVASRLIGPSAGVVGKHTNARLTAAIAKGENIETIVRELLMEGYTSAERAFWVKCRESLINALKNANVGDPIKFADTVMDAVSLKIVASPNVDPTAVFAHVLKTKIGQKAIEEAVIIEFNTSLASANKELMKKLAAEAQKKATLIDDLLQKTNGEARRSLRPSMGDIRDILKKAMDLNKATGASNRPISLTPDAAEGWLNRLTSAGSFVDDAAADAFEAIAKRGDELFLDLIDDVSGVGAGVGIPARGYRTMAKMIHFNASVQEDLLRLHLSKTFAEADKAAIQKIILGRGGEMAKAGAVESSLIISEILELVLRDEQLLARAVSAVEDNLVAKVLARVGRGSGERARRASISLAEAETAVFELLGRQLQSTVPSGLAGSEESLRRIAKALVENVKGTSKLLSPKAFDIAMKSGVTLLTAITYWVKGMTSSLGLDPADNNPKVMKNNLGEESWRLFQRIMINSKFVVSIYKHFIYETDRTSSLSGERSGNGVVSTRELISRIGKGDASLGLTSKMNAQIKADRVISNLREIKSKKALMWHLEESAYLPGQPEREDSPAAVKNLPVVGLEFLKGFPSKSKEAVLNSLPNVLIAQSGLHGRLQQYFNDERELASEEARIGYLKKKVFSISSDALVEEHLNNMEAYLMAAGEHKNESNKEENQMILKTISTKSELSNLVRQFLNEGSSEYTPYPYHSHIGEEGEPREDYIQDWKDLEMALIRDESRGTAIDIARILVKDLELFGDLLDLAGKDQSFGTELLKKIKEEQSKDDSKDKLDFS